MYCQPEDLKKLLPEREILELADDSEDASGVWTSEDVQKVILEAIDQADQEIDGFVGLTETLPLDPVPGLIRNLSQQMAVFYLFSRRSSVPEHWEKRYDACKKTLDKIATGKLQLGPQEGETKEPESDEVMVVLSPARMFDGSVWRKF